MSDVDQLAQRCRQLELVNAALYGEVNELRRLLRLAPHEPLPDAQSSAPPRADLPHDRFSY